VPRSAGFRVSVTRLDFVVGCQFMAIGMTLGAVPRFLREELGASRGKVGLATTIFFLSAILARPLIGRLIDTLGRRRFLLGAIAAMAVLSIGFEVAGSWQAVAVLRFLGGAFGAAAYTSMAAMASDAADPGRQASAIARLSFLVYVAFVIGPLVVDRLVPLGFTTTWAVITATHALAFLFALRQPETLSATSAAAAAAATGPSGSRRRLIHPAVVFPGLAMIASSFSFGTVAAFAPEFAEAVGIASTAKGSLFAVFAFAVLVVRTWTGRLADRRGPLSVAIPGLCIGGVGLTILALAPNPAVAYIGIALVGSGTGSTYPALSSFAISRVGTHERGSALAGFLMFNDIGQAASGPVSGFVSEAAGLRWVFGVPALVTVAGVVVALRLQSHVATKGASFR
jgi:MFS family permease